MSLLNYSDLQTAISNWLGGRSDLGPYIPDFITLFETAVNRRLRVRKMEVPNLQLTTTNGQTALPADYLMWRDLYWNGPSLKFELEWVHPSFFNYYYPTNATSAAAPSGTPTMFTIQDGTIFVLPFDDSSPLSLSYYQKLPPLSAGLNWLFQDHPDVYLWGSLAEAAGFTRDDNDLQKWVARRDAVFEEIETLDKRDGKLGGIRIIGPTP
jgi:hypothetical protein